MPGIYVHIPFCASRCLYCDFYSTLRSGELADRYVAAIATEAALRQHELKASPVKTLYMGGGTPSLLTIRQLRGIVEGIADIVPLSGLNEFTVEVNPDDVNPGLCDALWQMGVNRISMGVQSLNDDELRRIGRRHTAQQAVEAIGMLRHAGFDNISLDLISGLPGQTLLSWQRSLDGVLRLHPEHLSAYDLTYEPGTPLTLLLEQRRITRASDELCLAMYELLAERAADAGYEHYEISNYAQPDHRAQHNSAYWNGTPYVGLGAGAHSFDGTTRRHHAPDIDRYLTAMAQGTTDLIEEHLSTAERYDEMVMVSLRTVSGIDLQNVEDAFGSKARAYLLRQAAPHIQRGTLLLDSGQQRITLDWNGPNATRSVMTSDEIITDLMADGTIL